MLFYIIYSDYFVYGDFNSYPQFLIDSSYFYNYNSILDLRHDAGQFNCMVKFDPVQFKNRSIDTSVISNFTPTQTKYEM